MAIYKTEEEINLLAKGGKILAAILEEIISRAKPGVNIKDLDILAEKLIREAGGAPSFLYYKGDPQDKPFPSVMCISLNEEVVHGNGRRDIILQEGDLVDFDIGMRYPAKNGLYTDMAKTVGIGRISPEAKKLLEVTRQALMLGIKASFAGNSLYEVGKAIQEYVEKNNFSVVRDLGGHGVGHQVHEEPFIPNFKMASCRRFILKKNMVLALEPMVNAGGPEVEFFGWSVVTEDRSLSAHFEHTIVVGEKKGIILTK